VRQIWLKLTDSSEASLWLQAQDQIFGTLNPVSCLWKRPAEIAHIPMATTEAVIMMVAFTAARRFAHLTDFK